MKISSSSNYSLFKSNPFQRAFRPHKVDEIAAKMKANGFPPSMAISVYKGKLGEFIINTGHHRFAAAKALGIPVLYVIEHQWTMKQMVDEGTTVAIWDVAAAAQSFARSGIKDYQELLGFSDKGLPLTMAASLLIGEGAASGNARLKVINGTFKIKTREHAQKLIDLFEEFLGRVPAVKHRPFISVYSKCLLTPEFDESVFIRRLKANPLMLEKASNEDQQLKQVEEIYNFKSSSKIPLAFLVSKNSLERREGFGKGVSK